MKPTPEDYNIGKPITDDERKAAMFRLVDAEVQRYRTEQFRNAVLRHMTNEARAGR